MAKFKRYDPRNKKAERKHHRSHGRQSHHMEIKYFKQLKNVEGDRIDNADVYDYLEDNPFA